MAGETSECSVVVLIFLILTCSVSGVMAVLFVSGRLLDYYQLKLYGTSLFEGGHLTDGQARVLYRLPQPRRILNCLLQFGLTVTSVTLLYLMGKMSKQLFCGFA